MLRLIFISFSVFIVFDMPGQVQKNFAYYNNETYKLYEEKNWSALISLAKESIADGHDFYYMRMRIGIAYYESGKYIPAIEHFKKALRYDQSNPLVKEYLYYCHFYLGRSMEARKYYNYADLKNRFFNSIYFEPGIKISDGNTSTGNIRYLFTGLNHELGKNISLFHGFQKLGADLEATIDMPGNGGGPSTYRYSYTIVQNEYYAAMTFLIAKGLFVTPAFHTQGVSTTGYSNTNRVFSGQITKFVRRFKAYAGYSQSEINDLNQQQVFGGLVYYPLGNTKFYLNSEITNHKQDDKQTLITKNEMGITILPKTQISGSFTYGEMVNYNETNGYVVYNQLDIMNSKWSVSLNQFLGKHNLFINYTRENKEEFETANPFIHHDFIIGINLVF